MKNVSADIFAIKFKINVLFATKSDLKLKINKKDVKSHQKEKQSMLYDENKTLLLKYLNSNKYIQVKAHKVSYFDFNHLKDNIFANSNLLNAFIILLVDGISNVRFYFFI